MVTSDGMRESGRGGATTAQPASIPHQPPSLQVELALRRLVLRAGADLDALQDQLDVADLARSAGLFDAHRALCDVVFVRRGFSDGGLSLQQDVARGVAPRVAGYTRTRAEPGSGRSMIEVALAQVRGLAPLAAAQPLPPLSQDYASFAIPAATGSPEARLPGFVTLARDLRNALQHTPHDRLAALLERMRTEVVASKPFDLHLGDGCSAGDLAIRLAFNSLRRFAVATYRIGYPPFGSPALLAAASRLDDAGFGPYFRNLRHLLQDARSLLGFVALATEEQGVLVARGETTRWAALLAARWSESRLTDYVDLLADEGLTEAVWALMLFEHHAERQFDRSFYWRIRDAGVDGGDLSLAAAAQEALTGGWRGDWIEWVILADIAAARRDRKTVAAALEAAVSLDPGQHAVIERLEALARDDLTQWPPLVGGFNSSPERRARRKALRPAC